MLLRGCENLNEPMSIVNDPQPTNEALSPGPTIDSLDKTPCLVFGMNVSSDGKEPRLQEPVLATKLPLHVWGMIIDATGKDQHIPWKTEIKSKGSVWDGRSILPAEHVEPTTRSLGTLRYPRNATTRSPPHPSLYM